VSEAAAIARLFVALPITRPVAKALLKLQPPPSQTVKPVAEADFHITLHFLGGREIDPVRQALGTVTARPFVGRLNRTGHFSLRNGNEVLWVGVEAVEGLIALFRQSAAALDAVGFTPESRAYRPHITLARLAARTPASVADDFADSPLPGGPIEFECREFALYVSDYLPGVARYRIVERYPLVNRRGRRTID
jgi:2'-5' RNA ligase